MITFDGVTKRFPDGTVALDDVSLECPTGQITVFVGTSGGGKTTALRTINRTIEPTRGRVLIDGRDVRDSNPAELRRGIGYVIQQVGLFPHRTIADNIATVPYLLGWTKKKARARSLELMELVGLEPALAKRYPSQLSGGQQQRVGVARALAADPPIMLMDEPFSAVDPLVRAELQAEFLRLQQELEKTIVFVTHDIDEAIKLGDRIAVFRTGGRLVQSDTPENLLAHPADDFVAGFVGHDRGIRRLSFVRAAELPLRDSGVLPVTSSVADARAAGQEWVLAVDAARHPLGWARVADLPPSGTLANARLQPPGQTFGIDTDSGRTALDAAILSPSGQAVGVRVDGTVAGVVAHHDLSASLAAADGAGSARAGAAHGGSGQAGSGQANSGEVGAGQAGAGQTGSEQTGSARAAEVTQ